MPELAWAHVVEGLLTGRTQPPRKSGITMVIDKGHGPAATADMLEMCGDLIDHWKCTFGTSAFVPADIMRRKLAQQARQDLEWGAQWVTVESRESGKGIGIYDDRGAVREEAVAAICEHMGQQVDRLIWEAPLKNQQTFLIQQFGPDVNLGNIPTGEVLALEALRAGLRFETFYRIAEELERTGQ